MKKKKKKYFLTLIDALGIVFIVADIAYHFPASDNAARMPVEGLEEDGEIGTPAGIARRALVADLRTQALRVSIAGTRVTLGQAVEAMRSGGVAGVVRLTGDTLAPLPVAPPVGMNWADKFNEEAGAKIDIEPLRELIDKVSQQGVSSAKTVTELLESPAFSASRATMIIRTETAKAMMELRLEGMKDVKKRWVVSPGACQACMELDGEVLPLDVLFKTSAAFGNVLTPPAHPNCRCSIAEVKIK